MSKTMKLPKEAINEFKKIYKRKNGVDISNTEADRLGNKLLNLCRLAYLPADQNENEKFYYNTK